jgi:hypothetical protein
MSADLAGGVLQLVVRALPARQAEWGDAMRAELVGIAGRGERRRFAVGCVLALLRRPAGALAVAAPDSSPRGESSRSGPRPCSSSAGSGWIRR